MAKLEFRGYLPHQEKPDKFEEFREIASKVYKLLSGGIVFSWIETLEQFDIIENNTEISNIELKEILGKSSHYLA